MALNGNAIIVSMKKKLGNYIITAFLLTLVMIIIVGGVSILMVKDMLYNIYHIEEESRHIDLIDEIHDKVYNLVLQIHHFLLERDSTHLVDAIRAYSEIETNVHDYKELEMKELYPESREEVRILNRIEENLLGIKELITLYERFTKTGSYDSSRIADLERHGYNIESLIKKLNAIHFKVISRRVDRSYRRMNFVLVLYLLFSILGVIAVFIWYRLLTKKIIVPIKRLADATDKVAQGDLSLRVSTKSKTEVGTLYDSFNIMTGKIEEHEEKQKLFSKELETKVRERTQELNEANKTLHRAQAELIRMEKIATLGQIATSVNHEIKTPLNALYMNLQLLKKKMENCPEDCASLKGETLDIASVIDNEVIRINEILEEFVRYARFSPPELEERDLNRIVTDAANLLAEAARESDIEISTTLSDGLPLLMLDEKKIIQVLLNICKNSIEAMPHGGRLSIATSIDNVTVILKVSDTGTGISDKDISKVFTPFHTGKEGGLGFGLAIVQRIVEDHKGEISCESMVGEGATFRVMLPISPKED